MQGKQSEHRLLHLPCNRSVKCNILQGTSLVLGPLNYLFVHTFNSGKYCLGVFDNGRAGKAEGRACRQCGKTALVLLAPTRL